MTYFRSSTHHPMRRGFLAGAAVLALGLLPVPGEAQVGPPVGDTTQSTPTVDASSPCTGQPTPPGTWRHVTLIMFENKPLKQIIGNTTDAPYINSIAQACSYSSNTDSVGAASLANYLALTSGYTGCDLADRYGNCTHELEVTSNGPPSLWPQRQRSLFGTMDKGYPPLAASATEWGESMPSNCSMRSTPDFPVNHTPFQYYTRTQKTLCPQYARPFPTRPATVLAARFNLVSPNRIHIMHDPNSTLTEKIREGDAWLSGFLPQLLDSRIYQNGRSVIIITWDEGNDADATVPLIVISPYTTVGGVSTVAYDHYSTLKGIQQMLAVTPLLGHAADTGRTSIRDDPVFGLS